MRSMREPFLTRIQGAGLELQLYEWPGEGRPIFLAHATGFHARCWNQVVERLPGRRVYAIDMRGHGLSDKPEPPYPWRNFGRDVAAVAEQRGLRDAVAVGHSKGGFAMVAAAAAVPSAFGSMLLIDPVIMGPDNYETVQDPRTEHYSARRRNSWASPEEMFESFASRPPFDVWDRATLRDYCQFGLTPNPEGEGFVLACPPHIEAATYMGGPGDRQTYDDIHAIEFPVRVLRARPRDPNGPMDMSSSVTFPELWKHFKRGEDVSLPHMTHFIPMEDPDLVARHILEMA